MPSATRTILQMLADRAPDASICPSEVARELAPTGWRAHMDEVREAALELSKRGLVEITQKGHVVHPPFRGPIRIRRKAGRTRAHDEAQEPLVTPDGRYLVVKGRLWRRSNPHLDEATRARWVAHLMTARRAIARAKRTDDEAQVAVARTRVDEAKVALGERGDVWWTDGAPDVNRRLVENTPYAAWYAAASKRRARASR